MSSSPCHVLGQVACYGLIMRLKSIKFVLSSGCWPERSKSSGWGGAPFKPLDRLYDTEFSQYKVEQLYCHDIWSRCTVMEFILTHYDNDWGLVNGKWHATMWIRNINTDILELISWWGKGFHVSEKVFWMIIKLWWRTILTPKYQRQRKKIAYTCRISSSVMQKGKIVPVLFLTEHKVMKVYWESGGIAPSILDLSTRWRWVVSSHALAALPAGKELLVPTTYEAGWVQEPLWRWWWREKFPAPPPGIKP